MQRQSVLKHMSLLVGACVVFGGLVYWTSMDKPAVEAIVKFERNRDDPYGPKTQEEFDSYIRTHASLMKSSVVINSALRDNDVRQLEVVRSMDYPIDELSSLIQTVVGSNQLVGVRLQIPRGHRDKVLQWETVLDAVIAAYQSEIVNTETLSRVEHLAQLRRRQANVESDLRARRDELLALKKTLGLNGNTSYLKERSTRRIDMCESKLLDFELERRLATASGNAPPADVVAKVKLVTQIRDSELEKLAKLSNDLPSNLTMKEEEIEKLVADLFSVIESVRQFEKLVDGPPAVSVVQNATPTHLNDEAEIFADAGA